MPITKAELAARKQAASQEAAKPEPLAASFPFTTDTQLAFAAQATIPAKDVIIARLPRQDWALDLVRHVRALCDTVRENIQVRATPSPITMQLLGSKPRTLSSKTTYEVLVSKLTSGLDMARLLHIAGHYAEQIQLVLQPTPEQVAARPPGRESKPEPTPEPKPSPAARLRHHITGAIERGKAEAVVAKPTPPAKPEPKPLAATVACTPLAGYDLLKAARAEKPIRGIALEFKDDPKDPTIKFAGNKRALKTAHRMLENELPENLELVLLDEGGEAPSALWVVLGIDYCEPSQDPQDDDSITEPADPADPQDDPTVEEKGPIQRADEATLQSEFRAGKRPRFHPKRNQVARKWGCFDLETLEFVRGKNAATEARAVELCEDLNLPAPSGAPATASTNGTAPAGAPLPLTEDELQQRYVVSRNGQAQEWQVKDTSRDAWMPDTGSLHREEARNLARVLNQPPSRSKQTTPAASSKTAPAPAAPKPLEPAQPPTKSVPTPPKPPAPKTGPAPIRKADVAVGKRYRARIGDDITTVRITHVLPSNRGWDAVNETSGRTVHIKSAQKLRSEVLA